MLLRWTSSNRRPAPWVLSVSTRLRSVPKRPKQSPYAPSTATQPPIKGQEVGSFPLCVTTESRVTRVVAPRDLGMPVRGQSRSRTGGGQDTPEHYQRLGVTPGGLAGSGPPGGTHPSMRRRLLREHQPSRPVSGIDGAMSASFSIVKRRVLRSAMRAVIPILASGSRVVDLWKDLLKLMRWSSQSADLANSCSTAALLPRPSRSAPLRAAQRVGPVHHPWHVNVFSGLWIRHAESASGSNLITARMIDVVCQPHGTS